MRFSASAGLLAFAASAHAFADTSPFVLLSTSEFERPLEEAQLQASSEVTKSTFRILESCPTERYYFIFQENANAADIRGPEGCKVPSLCNLISDEQIKSTYSVAEVAGDLEAVDIQNHILASCEKQGKAVKISDTRLPALTATERDSRIADNDQIINEVIDDAKASGPFTLLYIAGSGETAAYEADFGNAVSEELKKLRARFVSTRQSDNNTAWDKLPLFEKYQFFTPGIFHGIVGAIVILSILGVGLRAIGSLEVPYAAFDKEMGPAAQKKQN